MNQNTLEIKLISDTLFAMGSGVTGLLDSEIQHDESGLPILSGRAIKGLLVNECSLLLYAIRGEWKERFYRAASRLFGERGQTEDQSTMLLIGQAGPAPDLAAAVRHDNLPRQDVIDSLTTIRRQTAMDVSGAPLDRSLRTIRVLIRGLTLYAPLYFTDTPEEDDLTLLAICTMMMRRAGLERNRGLGHIKASITDRPLQPDEFSKTQDTYTDLTPCWLENFKREAA